jgi:hypothetical protein
MSGPFDSYSIVDKGNCGEFLCEKVKIDLNKVNRRVYSLSYSLEHQLDIQPLGLQSYSFQGRLWSVPV